MWRWEDEKMRRSEKMWEDYTMWRCENKMWEDVRRCDKMWEDVRRCEDEKMWWQTSTIRRTLRSDALGKNPIILPMIYTVFLMISHYTTLDGWNPWSNGINHLSTGAGFRNHPQYFPITPWNLHVLLIDVLLHLVGWLIEVVVYPFNNR